MKRGRSVISSRNVQRLTVFHRLSLSLLSLKTRSCVSFPRTKDARNQWIRGCIFPRPRSSQRDGKLFIPVNSRLSLISSYCILVPCLCDNEHLFQRRHTYNTMNWKSALCGIEKFFVYIIWILFELSHK